MKSDITERIAVRGPLLFHLGGERINLPAWMIRTWKCATVVSLAMLCCASVRSQSSTKRCITVGETFNKIHQLNVTPQTKPIKHCYSERDHPYRYSVVDIPVSIAIGDIRTPEFSPASSWYWIMIQVEKPLPTKLIGCMLAVADDSPQSWQECPLSDRLLQAEWTVWEDGKIASRGSSATHADGAYTRDNVFKFLGKFPVLAAHKYVVEVKFIKDATPLHVANPHLIVTKIGNE